MIYARFSWFYLEIATAVVCDFKKQKRLLCDSKLFFSD